MAEQFSVVQVRMRDQYLVYNQLAHDILWDVGTLRRSLPIRELVDPVAMPSRDDTRMVFVRKLEEAVALLVHETGKLLDVVKEAEHSPYPTPRQKYKHLPFGTDDDE